MKSYDEQQLARLLAQLPPAPEGWVRAAEELPRARAALDDLVERAVRDAEFRALVEADLEEALRRSGREPDPATVAALRARLSDAETDGRTHN